MRSDVDDFLTFLADRRSIRWYQARPVDKGLLNAVVEAARWAPSAHNRQPWRIVVLTKPEAKLRLARVMADRLRRERLADGDNADEVADDVQRSVNKLQQAAALIVVFVTMEAMDHYADQRRNRLEHLMAVQSTAMAGQNMLLMAHSLGLGACWVCAPMFADQEAKAALDCPADWEPQGLITIGWPQEIPAARERKTLEEITRWR
ncbi:MAG: nitroreductase family protein [Anaerolineales bacterium]